MMRRVLQESATWFLTTLHTHPLSLSAATLTAFSILGMASWKMMEPLDSESNISDRQKRKVMSLEEARLRAMIENAKDSSWKENLDNAVTAHERFMLPGRQNGVPEFVKNIDKRSQEILKDQQDQFEKERKRKNTVTQFW